MTVTNATLDFVIPAKDASAEVPACLAALQSQQIPAGWTVGVVVVDDGSVPALELAASDQGPLSVELVRLAQNQGRSGARNAGIAHSRAEFCFVLDADCVLADALALSRAVAVLAAGADFCFGRTRDRGDDFWARYHNSVAARRVAASGPGDYTTACFAFRRARLREAGGFNAAYRHYGFEDKDLVAVLQQRYGAAALRHDEQLVAYHDDSPTLALMLAKYHEMGEYSAPVFMSAHPAFYQQLTYARFDACLIAPHRRLLIALLSALTLPARGLVSWGLGRDWLPFIVQKTAVQVLCALSFFDGSRQRTGH